MSVQEKEDEKPLLFNDDPEIMVKPQISPLKFVFVIYFCVCGGAYGIEQAVQEGWPAFALAFILVVPLIWNIPIALITAELGSALPTNEGVFVWIHEAFGSKLSFPAAIVYWLNYTVDTALYPGLFIQYFLRSDQELFGRWYLFYGIPIGLILIITIFNLLGVDVIGSLSTVLVVIQSIPIIIMFLWAAADGKVIPSDWIKLRQGDWGPEMIDHIGDCFQIVVWSYSGYDSIGSIVEELKDADKNLNKTLIAANVLSCLTYVIGVLAGIGVERNYENWDEGSFSSIGEKIGGPWLRYSVIAAGCLATAGTSNALMFPTSQQLWALGGEEYLDIKFLQYKHPRFNTPWIAIIINAVICCVSLFIPFLTLVQINNVLYSFLIFLVCCTVVKLRYSKRGRSLNRPYKIAESNIMVIMFVLWPIIVSMYLIVSATMDNWVPSVACVGLTLALVVLYFLCEFRKKRRKQNALKSLGRREINVG